MKTYNNRELGISLSHPADWRVTTLLDMDVFRTRMAERADMALAHLLNSARLPLLAVFKHPDSYDDVNPAIQLAARKVSGANDLSPEQLARGAFEQLQQFPDAKLESLDTLEVSGCPARDLPFWTSRYALRLGALERCAAFRIVPNRNHYVR